MRILFLVVFLFVIAGIEVARTEEILDELSVNDEGDELIVREERAAKGRQKNKNKGKECRYAKGSWGECSPLTNQRVRTLTLKKGDSSACEESRTETKKCKRMCRYSKGQWSDCVVGTNQMERVDTLKTGSDQTCEPTQKKIKKCKGKSKKGRY